MRHAASRSGSGQYSLDGGSQIRRLAEPGPDLSQGHGSRRTQLSQELAPSPLLPSPPSKQASLAPSNGPAASAGTSPDHAKAGSGSSHELSLAEQKRLESELLAEADEARPRTLKEARERARLRKQQTETTSSPPATANANTQSAADTPSPRKGASLHIRDVAASTAAAALADEAGPRSSIESRDRPVRNPKRISNLDSTLAADHRSISERSNPSDYSGDSGVEGAFSFDDPVGSSSQLLTLPAGADPQATSMDDLTDAVNSAMNDLSFGDDTLSAEDEFATPLAPVQQETRQLPPTLPSARSLASVTGAGVSSPLASPNKFAAQTPRSHVFPPSVSKQSLVPTPLASPVQQRVIQPSVPDHIDIYGKTVPMPKAFASKAITVDKRRLSSWERARTYAQYTNELLHLETGLHLWMEVVQRPAARQANRGKPTDDWLASGTIRSHVRNEGSYADSIRSDMTFPMRGDGAKAKEIVSVLPTMEESPVLLHIGAGDHVAGFPARHGGAQRGESVL
uniref:Uncharacterized protein n=1 Tax=Kalmanozyma brasiliensis (strain GHG001) TaxID=1365824 RepID=V5GVM8_KALBG